MRRFIVSLALIGLFAHQAIAAEYAVYSVYRGLNLGGSEEAPRKDYYVNMGSKHGLHEGSTLQVLRRFSSFDLSNDRLYRDVVFPIAIIKLIHVEPMTSIARLDKMLPLDTTPSISPRAIMVGDLVEQIAPPTP